MRVLLVKTTSLGDVIHALPALTDAKKHFPDLQCDWVVEQSFAEIPKLHPAVSKVIPVSIRKWRKNKIAFFLKRQWRDFIQAIKHQHYDYIIDAQSLTKSALLAFFAKGKRIGYDWHSAREPWVTFSYHQKINIDKQQHATQRIRELFAKTFDYPTPTDKLNYGLTVTPQDKTNDQKCLIFFHGTTWNTKHWPEEYWQALAKLAAKENFHIKLPWGNEIEYQRANRIAEQCEAAHVLPKCSLTDLARTMIQAKGIVAVDTGLTHLAAALNKPTVSLYGPTNPNLTGSQGDKQIHLSADFKCAPCLQRTCSFKEKTTIFPACFANITPENVWETLKQLL